jgi:hypothetical protein
MRIVRTTILAAVIASVALLVVAVPAQAMVEQLTPDELAQRAATIVVGRVASSNARRLVSPAESELAPVVTDTRVDVTEVLKGDATSQLTLTLPGGRLAGTNVWVSNVPTFVPGERCILFLDGRGRLLGWRAGKLEIVDGFVPAMDASLQDAERRISQAAGAPADASASRRLIKGGEALAALGASPLRLSRPPAASPNVPQNGPRAGPATVLLEDGFETGFSWTATIGSGATPATWGRSSLRAASGTYSAYSTQTYGTTHYPNNTDARMTRGPFDLSACNVASLSYDLWLDSEEDFDGIIVYYSTDGVNFGSLTGWTGYSAGWFGDRVMLDGSEGGPNLCGQAQVWIMFRFVSDEDITYEGAYVDDVRLTKNQVDEPPHIDEITPDGASAGTDTPVTITGSGFGPAQGLGSVEFFVDDGWPTLGATVTSWSDTQITCTVPTGIVWDYPSSAASGPVRVITDDGLVSASHDFLVSFGYEGFKWPTTSVGYKVNANTIDTDAEEAMVDAAAATWSAPSQFTLVDDGPSTNSSIYTPWNYELPDGVIGGTMLRSDGAGNLLESDIVLNDDYDWSDGSRWSLDVQTAVAHELGHVVGLLDLYGGPDAFKVMYGYGGFGLSRRFLDPADEAGAVWIYGPRGDVTPPTTTDDADDAWHRSDVTVTLTASDEPGGSGMLGARAMTQYKIDGAGSWTKGTGVTIVAAADHLGDGLHTVTYRSVDAAGNIEADKTCEVRIDTTRPAVKARRAYGARRGRTCRIRYEVSDVAGVTVDTTISIRSSGGTLVKKLRQKGQPVGTTLVARFRCRLAAGSYKVTFAAIDQAGNRQARLRHATLIVR